MSACYELSNCLPLWNISENRSQVAAILEYKMAVKMWTYQLATIKIPVERYLNYLSAKIHIFIQKCTSNYLIAPLWPALQDLQCKSMKHARLLSRKKIYLASLTYSIEPLVLLYTNTTYRLMGFLWTHSRVKHCGSLVILFNVSIRPGVFYNIVLVLILSQVLM